MGKGMKKAVKKSNFIEVDEVLKDFIWEATDEPHATRRKLILEKYPEIKKLYGHCPKTKYFIAFAVTAQTILSIVMRHQPWYIFLAVAYIFGGTMNHMCMMGLHELSHNLGFKKMLHNRIFGFFCNYPLLVPAAISFKRYHMEHHRYQGEEGVDVDVPTEAEGKFFNTPIKKFFFVIFQGLFYSLRPMIVNPKPITMWELGNLLSCLTYDFIMYYFFGGWSLAYLGLSTFFGTGIHPIAGHFIAEHYVFIKGFETYSYYGILNFFTFNVGYHNEHHDFPYVPGSRLPRVRSIAPEFYDNLPKHTSWSNVIVMYVTNPFVSAFSRVKRKTLNGEEKAKLKLQ